MATRQGDQGLAHVGRPDPLASRTVRWLALAGVVGPLVFVVVSTVEGLLRPGYSSIRQSLSTLGEGSGAWLSNGSGVLTAVLLIVFVVGFDLAMRRVLSAGWRRACTVLLVLPPIGLAVAAIFTGGSGPIHWLVGGTLLFFSPIVAFLVTGLALRSRRGWRGWAMYSLAAAVLTLLLGSLLFFGSQWTRPFVATPLGGLEERLVVYEVLAWYVLFGFRLIRAPR